MTKAELEYHFDFDPITQLGAEKIGAIRAAGKTLALSVFANAPDGDLKELAIGHVIEAVCLANAAVANAHPVEPPTK
jgi:hypothetical protein